MPVRFKLRANPTFKSKVSLPVHGGGEEEVEFEFRHRTRDEFNEWVKKVDKDYPDFDLMKDLLAGWEFEETFNDDNIRALIQDHIAVPRLLLQHYVNEVSQARLKN